MSAHLWVKFALAWTLLTLPFGPNAVNTMVSTMANGLSRGMLVPLGIGMASLIFGLTAAFGVGAILVASPTSYLVAKVVGAIYLAYLAVDQWRKADRLLVETHGDAMSSSQLFTSGCLVSLSNPKAALTYLAVYPQFIDRDSSIVPQLLILLPTTFAVVMMVYTGYALLAAPLRCWLGTVRRRVVFSRVIACLYMIGAALIVATGHS